MKRFFLSVTALGLLLIGTGSVISSCSREGSDSTATSQTSSDIEVKNFDLNIVNKSASANYRVVQNGDTAYLSIGAEILWPVNVNGLDIKVLQDSILNLAFASDKKSDIDASIRSFVSDVNLVESTDAFTRVDKIPADAADNGKAYEMAVTGTLLQTEEALLTYQVSGYSYTGGAHPNATSYPFTYFLATKQVLTNSNLFKAGSEDALARLIREAIARQYKVPASDLVTAGFFTNDIPVSPMVYVSNGEVVFHYNPYDIAPHSMGAIDVWLYPYEVQPYLTDLGTSVLFGK
ncbi:MAG: DUF3298 and DUF4163 domain-containing protein [Paramuribaculum sp.]|nr:DUF3298 and DUF4163 domain-containing protein [Paramuribaculum sp.]